MATALAALPSTDPTSAPSGEGPLHELLSAIWDHTPARVALVSGRWRWKGVASSYPEIREILAWKLRPGTVPFDPQRAERVTLPPTAPSSRPFEVALYPALLIDPMGPGGTLSGAHRIYLCLFYSMQDEGSDSTTSTRERAYFRVVEALDRFHGELVAGNPGSSVRAIDVPMPGWMSARLGGSGGNACPLLTRWPAT